MGREANYKKVMNKLSFAFFLSFIFSIQPIIGQNNCFNITIDSLTTNDIFLFVFTDISQPSNHKLSNVNLIISPTMVILYKII